MRRENVFDEKAVNEVLEACDKDRNGKPAPDWDTLKEECGERLVNPLITLQDCDTSYGVIVDQYTGKSMNSNTYFDNILDVHRNRAKMFENKEGLEYNIISADATDPAAVYVLFDHNIHNLFKAIIDSLYTDLRASLCSSAAYISSIVKSYLDKRYGSFIIFNTSSVDDIISKMHLIDEITEVPITMEKITPEWLFSYGSNVKMTVMTEFCKVVYEAIQKWVYCDFTHQGSFKSTVEVTDSHVDIKSGIYTYNIEVPEEGRYVTRKLEQVPIPGLTLDMVYRDVCTIIYPQLELIDASLAAILVAHVEKAASCYSDYIKLYEEATRNLNDKED